MGRAGRRSSASSRDRPAWPDEPAALPTHRADRAMAAAVVAVQLQEGLGHAWLGPDELDERVSSHHRQPVLPANEVGRSTKSMTMLIPAVIQRSSTPPALISAADLETTRARRSSATDTTRRAPRCARSSTAQCAVATLARRPGLAIANPSALSSSMARCAVPAETFGRRRPARGGRTRSLDCVSCCAATRLAGHELPGEPVGDCR
jgi:hypothetical protein